MTICRCILIVAAMIIGAGASLAETLNPGVVTCHEFLASGQANMAALIMWLRGHHAGKTGTSAYQKGDPYGGRLGYYCKQHPDVKVIEASEQILTTLDSGI